MILLHNQLEVSNDEDTVLSEWDECATGIIALQSIKSNIVGVSPCAVQLQLVYN